MYVAGNLAEKIEIVHSGRAGANGGRKSPSKKAPRSKSPRNEWPGTAADAEPAVNGHPTAAVGLTNLKIIRNRFVFDTQTGKFHRISETAAFLLIELQRQTPVADLVMRYAERYAVPHPIAERDLELFLNDLAVAGGPTYGHPAPPQADRERLSARPV